jgi:uncharacterized membrane protein YfcA
MSALAWLGAILVGLTLGLTGAGGSVVTLPVLVYLAGVTPVRAVALSLLVVGTAALVGAIQRWRAGNFHARAALLFAVSGMAGAWAGAKLTPMVPPGLLMAGFALLMIIVSLRMIVSREEPLAMMPDCRPLRCVAAGAGVGLLTGFLGVGGGFLLVPALVKFARLPLRMAAGTSLAVIAFNSAAGLLSHLSFGPVDWQLGIPFVMLAVAGVLIGNSLASKLPVKHLRQGFAVMVLLTGAAVLWRSLGGP